MFSVKKELQKILQIHWKTPVLESLFNKVADIALLKKRVWHRWFPVNFAKFLRKVKTLLR